MPFLGETYNTVSTGYYAEKLFDGLPRPIILLHANGTNLADMKSLPMDTAFNLQKELVQKTSGSVVVLDWSERTPVLTHPRVRSIANVHPQGTPLEELAAVIEGANLTIGVDSGVFHFTAFTTTPSLGVFRKIAHCRCCLPNPHAVYMVPGALHHEWEKRRGEWPMVEYAGEEPTAAEIADQAHQILVGRARHTPRIQDGCAEQPFFVGVPTLSRYDLLAKCLDSINRNSARPKRVIVIDNGGGFQTDNPLVDVIRPARNLGLSASYNLIHKLAGPHPTFYLNDDVELPSDAFARMLTHAEWKPPVVTGYPGDQAFACILLREEFWQRIGEFDENFWPAYCEDGDIEYRLKLAGMRIEELHLGVSHVGTATKHSLPPEKQEEIHQGWLRNLDYYRRKWGGEPRGGERYTVPFNGGPKC